MEKNNVKSLVLISYESDNFEDLLDKIEYLKNRKNEVTVISLSIETSIELKKRKISYKTPNYYMGQIDYVKIDEISLKFAREWYKPFEKKIMYKGISLGNMLEYDFYFLFVDALRSVEIGKNLLLSENPDFVYLPINLKMNDPNVLCYESLPKVIEFLDQNSIKNSIKKIDLNDGIKFDGLNKLFSITIFDLLFCFYTKLINLYQIYILSQLNFKVILFWNTYSYKDISENLKNQGYHSNRIYPIKVNNQFSKNKIREINHLQYELSNNNYSEIKLFYKGLDLTFILIPRIIESFNQFKDLVQYLEWAELFTNKFPESILISMEDVTPIKRTIFRWFKMKNMPSIVIQHGLVAKDMSGFGIMPIEANKQAVWGDHSLNWHLKRGNDAQVITGNPVFDKILPFRIHSNKKQICNKLKLDSSKKIILVTTERFAGITSEYTIEDEETKIRKTIKSLNEFVHEQIIIKLHPGHPEKYKRIISNIATEENIDLLIFLDHYWDLIFVCDVLITFTSTTGLEAMLFEKPVIAIGTKEEVDQYTSNIAAVGVHELEHLGPIIRNIIYGDKLGLNKPSEDLTYQNNYLNDCKASKRLADLIIRELTNVKQD